MSDVIKMGVKPRKVNFKLSCGVEEEIPQSVQEAVRIRELMEEQYNNGYNEGRQAAISELQEEYDKNLQSKYEEVDNILEQISNELNKYDSAFETLVVKLALIMGEKIVKREVNAESHITQVLSESVRKVLGSNNIIVKLNPADYYRIKDESSDLFTEPSFSKIKFESDERIESGGCFVETEIGNVDARLSTQINEIKKQLEISIEADR